MSATDGCEWVIDAYGCDPARLATVESMRALFARLITMLDLRPIAEPIWHVFPAVGDSLGGVTGLCALAESHLTVHTFPEHRSLCLNLFCCRPRDDWDVERELRPLIGAADFGVRVRRLERHFGSVRDVPPLECASLGPRVRLGG